MWLFSYERIVPTSMKNGVVLFTMLKDKIVLIRQFRHSIRNEQLCCPRGFGECNIIMVDHAKKELYEELNAIVIDEPIELGVITGDSGLSSGSATVFLMKIDSYTDSKEEGIREIVELTPDDFLTKMNNNEIEDGYSLATFALYNAYVATKKK